MKLVDVTGSASNKWLMVVPKDIYANDKLSGNCKIISLPHPRTTKRVKFMLFLKDDRSEIFEINKHLDDPASWFINDEFVKSDGSIFMVTKIDPLFILLAHLYSDETGKFVLVDQLITGCRDPPNIGKTLLNCMKDKSQMNNIADSAGTDDLIAYRFNEAKTLIWLKQKVNLTIDAVKESGMFICESDEAATGEDVKKRYACGVVSDYIPVKLHKKLLNYLGIPERIEKRKSVGPQSSAKKVKTEALEDYSKVALKHAAPAEKKNLTKAQKALSKVDKKGMKTMSSFFAAKPKK